MINGPKATSINLHLGLAVAKEMEDMKANVEASEGYIAALQARLHGEDVPAPTGDWLWTPGAAVAAELDGRQGMMIDLALLQPGVKYLFVYVATRPLGV